MASRLLERAWSLFKAQTTLSFTATYDAANNLTAVVNKGFGTITRDGAGVYSVLITDQWAKLLNAQVSWSVNAADSIVWEFAAKPDVSNATAASRKFVLRSVGKDGTPVAEDPAAAHANNLVYVTLTVSNSSRD